MCSRCCRRGCGETQITVLPIDPRLRLAQCGSALAAQLPPGANLAARATVGVTCAGPTHWSVYVPVVVESRISVLVLRHAVARDARLTADDVALETRRTAGTAAAYLDARDVSCRGAPCAGRCPSGRH